LKNSLILGGCVIACSLHGSVFPSIARAEGPVATPIDGVALRFFAPEAGGATHPRFITDRVLAFEARLEAKGEDATYKTVQDRHVRAAIERHVTEEILASLPMERAPDAEEVTRAATELRAALVQRIGGEFSLAEEAATEGIAPEEVNAILIRRARAALYVHRAIVPILYPSEEEVREVFRTASHPFHAQKFEEARVALTRWFVEERLRSAESAYYQAARTRIQLFPTKR
jgi:hypothetical protein